MIGFHAFTGSDATAAFAGKGKQRPFSIMVKKESFLSAFSCLGTTSQLSTETVKLLEQFTSKMYGENCTSVNVACSLIFTKKAKPKKGKGFFETVKAVLPSQLPPCYTVHHKKIMRANFVSTIWRKAHLANPVVDMIPRENGWELKEGGLCPVWDSKPSLPDELNYPESKDSDVEEEEIDYETSSADDNSDSD